jgi:hypothetical protein
MKGKGFAQIASLALSFAIGCAHTKTTDDGSEKHEKQESKRDETKKAEKPRAHETSPNAGRADGVPLATAPAGLLAPGADQKICDRLVAEGFLADDAKRSDGAMSEGLRRFQRARDLPATGVPDDQTVKDLGLNPDEIFRHGTVKD